jgi:hypothetical protein
MTGCRGEILSDERQQRRDQLRVGYSQEEHAKENERYCPFEPLFTGHARMITRPAWASGQALESPQIAL